MKQQRINHRVTVQTDNREQHVCPGRVIDYNERDHLFLVAFDHGGGAWLMPSEVTPDRSQREEQSA